MSVFSFLRRLRKDDSGATAIEYGLIAALIAVALVGALTALGSGEDGAGGLAGLFDSISGDVSGAIEE